MGGSGQWEMPISDVGAEMSGCSPMAVGHTEGNPG